MEDQIKYGLKSLSTDSFEINSSNEIDVNLNEQHLFFSITCTINSDIIKNEIDVKTVFELFSEVKNDVARNIITAIKSTNTFLVDNLNDILNSNHEHLPSKFKQLLLKISIDHTRAVHAEKIRGTSADGSYIPFVKQDESILEYLVGEAFS